VDLVATLEKAQRDSELVELVARLDMSEPRAANNAQLPVWLSAEIARLGVERHEFLHHLHTSIVERRAWPSDQTCVPGDVVVVVPSIDEEETLSYGGRDAVLATIRRPAVEVCFCITVHKSQGATIKKLVVVLLKRPGNNHNVSPYNFNNIYVVLSRVGRGDDIRFVFNEGEFDWDALLPPNNLVAFLSGYDEHGVWSRARAFATAADLRKATCTVPASEK
jgi:hypothetical protein